ncbi:MAG: flagellar biosynthesis anti-sigma factor FlgM [Thiotrichales bacterium]|nr:flagellar biosynthesis anti-sigma factor FlgM [Thiotrichales bacterium]
MDIKNLNANVTSGRAPDQVRAQERSGKQDANQSVDNAPTDKVTLTGTLTQVRDLEQKTENVNIDNSDRIATLKAAIADGSYQVNAQNIAEKFMQSESFLSKI